MYYVKMYFLSLFMWYWLPIPKTQPITFAIIATPSDTTIRVSLHIYRRRTIRIYVQPYTYIRATRCVYMCRLFGRDRTTKATIRCMWHENIDNTQLLIAVPSTNVRSVFEKRDSCGSVLGFVNNWNTDRNTTLPKLNGTKKCNSEKMGNLRVL